MTPMARMRAGKSLRPNHVRCRDDVQPDPCRGCGTMGCMGFMDFLLGQKTSDVELDPRFAEAQRRRELLAQQFQAEALGGSPPGV